MITAQAVIASGSSDARRGMDLLDTPVFDKGAAFTEKERTRFGLHGLLPPHAETLDEQVARAYEAFQKKDNDLERHMYLCALQDTNEVLFYRLLLDRIEQMTSLVYTPTVALACEQFSHIYRRPGLFISDPLPIRKADPVHTPQPVERHRQAMSSSAPHCASICLSFATCLLVAQQEKDRM